MREVTKCMLIIKAQLDNKAVVTLSEYTQQWYVVADINLGGDGLLLGFTEHRDTPEEAVLAYWGRLINIESGKRLVTRGMYADCRYYIWNGASFHHIPRDCAV